MSAAPPFLAGWIRWFAAQKLKKKLQPNARKRRKCVSGHSAERLVGHYTPKRSQLKIAVETTVRRLVPILLAWCLRSASRQNHKGERAVPPVVAPHGRFLCTNLGRRSIFKRKHSHPTAHPCRGWSCEVAMFVKYLPRAKLRGGHVCLSKTVPAGFSLCSGHSLEKKPLHADTLDLFCRFFPQ